jgi:hypothetical protein
LSGGAGANRVVRGRIVTKRLSNLQWIALAAIGCSVLVLVWQIVAGSGPDATTLAVLLVLLAGFGALLDPVPFRSISRRVTGFEGFGVKVGLEVQRARDVDARFPARGSDDGVSIKPRQRYPDDPKAEVRGVVDHLRGRLRFVVKAVLGEDELVIEPRPGLEELITEQPLIARLESVGLLEREEARLAHELLGDLGGELPDWDAADRQPFLDNAWNFANRLTTGLFDRYARKRFKEAGWFVGDFKQEKGHRPEFIVVKQDRWACVAARVADPPKTQSLDRTIDRLASGPEHDLPQGVLLVPDHVDGLRGELNAGPVRLAGGKVLAVRLEGLVESPETLASIEPGPLVSSLAPDEGAEAGEPDEGEVLSEDEALEAEAGSGR